MQTAIYNRSAVASPADVSGVHALKEGNSPLDVKALRNALGAFPTGIAIVTTRNASGRAVGLTINSFASLSLDPPLVLWSLVNRSPSLAAFNESDYFCINVLASTQTELAKCFASSAVPDKFQNVQAYDSVEGIPVIPGCLASFVCAREQMHPGGDHTLYVGRVLHYFVESGEPAVFHRGQFTNLHPSQS
ncbi:flavin reductase family protein [Glaciimonas soli]|uniref:Flavin reductase n=1 Tax=Glaciimonas soli TaxID=2590999 RepID=A0A843YS48_9BURK|nr:flavin reductase family protein [Glaciimonas soli]MQR00072.1 flavin reductase [Glaciimonas soli]